MQTELKIKKFIKLILIGLILLFAFNAYSWMHIRKFNTDDFKVIPNEWVDQDKTLKEFDKVNEARKSYHRMWLDSEIKHNFILSGLFLGGLVFLLLYNNTHVKK